MVNQETSKLVQTIYGYNGYILRVNLSNNKLIKEPIDEAFCRKYLGGAGFIAYYLWKELKPGTDALSPDNKLIFALGPVSGLTVPGAARNCVGAKSPLTGGLAKAEVGGFWMAELKRGGFDAIIVEGKAIKPVYLWIHDGEAEIKDASHIWGQHTKETESTIRSDLGDNRVQVAMIGLAGENLVRYACIMQGCHDAAGRGGLGAVMGSKNLKAVAVRGHTLPPIVDAERVKDVRRQLIHPYSTSEYGTGGPYMVPNERAGDLPIRNFGDGWFPEVSRIHGGVIKETIRIGMEGCFACPVRCKKVTKFEEPYSVDPIYGGPEYETLAALGSDCGISDLKAIVKGNERCNAYSMDTISTGSTIAFAMECYHKGLITKEDTGGLELTWGNADAMLKLIELIARREGFGNLLAEGTARMSEKIGPESQSFALHVKGLEPGMHDLRIGSGLAMGFMLSPTGADHCVVAPDGPMSNEMPFKMYHALGWLKPPGTNELTPRKTAIFRQAQFWNITGDSLVVCQFPNISFDQTVELLKAVTGWDTGLGEMMQIGERIITLMRLFIIREGATRTDDKLPGRFFQPTKGGDQEKLTINPTEYDKVRDYYYALMGWDAVGVPLPDKVKELEIE
jgi:aldehyde:ferredoxin oxidoreductase